MRYFFLISLLSSCYHYTSEECHNETKWDEKKHKFVTTSHESRGISWSSEPRFPKAIPMPPAPSHEED